MREKSNISNLQAIRHRASLGEFSPPERRELFKLKRQLKKVFSGLIKDPHTESFINDRTLSDAIAPGDKRILGAVVNTAIHIDSALVEGSISEKAADFLVGVVTQWARNHKSQNP